MTAEDYEWLEITTGRERDFYLDFASTTDVDPGDIRAVLEFRVLPDSGSALVVSCATADPGGADGTIEITQIGADPDNDVWTYEAHCHLTDVVTASLRPVIDAQAGWGDLKLWADSVDGGAAQFGGRYQLRILSGVTA